jgi:predicted nucleotidyltransferase
MSEAMLELAAEILGPLVDDVVFVGGATVHLWVTEEAAPPVRATDDVDVICDVMSYAEYQTFAARLRERDLQESMDEPVICRWRHRESGLAIDVMPSAEDVLGFSSRWYQLAVESAIERTLSSGARIRAVSPPIMIATKLAAWRGRGHGDVLASLDVHDIVVLVDGRPELIDELVTQGEDLRLYVAEELAALRNDPYFEYVVQSAVTGYGEVASTRAEVVLERIAAISDRLNGLRGIESH